MLDIKHKYAQITNIVIITNIVFRNIYANDIHHVYNRWIIIQVCEDYYNSEFCNTSTSTLPYALHTNKLGYYFSLCYIKDYLQMLYDELPRTHCC